MEIDEARSQNENLNRTIHSLTAELQDGIKMKQSLKSRLERVQTDMAETCQNIARDQAAWRHKEEDHKAKHEYRNARLEAEVRARERLELEIDRLEKQEKESMKARLLVDQIRGENNHLSSMVNELRSKSNEYMDRAATFERELHDARESNRLESQRTFALAKADVTAANQQLHILRADLEGVIGRLEAQLEHAKKDAGNSKQRYELMLEEASVSKSTALREAAEAREAALQEHYRFHEKTLEDLQASHSRILEDAKASYERALSNEAEDHERMFRASVEDHKRASVKMSEEKQMSEEKVNVRLVLADEKVNHYRDRIQHLEEKLEIAKSAAQAAAEAARSARGSPSVPASSQPSMSMAKGSESPGKISPQALRESILTLQDQLHNRENQIEQLEQELSEVDKDAPKKLNDQELEISWLRELLGVRLDDLQDIIVTLSSPSYDRDAVRDAVIRLRANLQMEQQEKSALWPVAVVSACLHLLA